MISLSLPSHWQNSQSHKSIEFIVTSSRQENLALNNFKWIELWPLTIAHHLNYRMFLQKPLPIPRLLVNLLIRLSDYFDGDMFVESMIFKRYRSPEKDRFAQSPPKLERQSITVSPEKRLPILYSLTSEDDQRRKSEFRRRQVCWAKIVHSQISIFIYFSLDICLEPFHASSGTGTISTI